MKFSPESYARWRAGLPWTDEEFAVIHEQMAANCDRESSNPYQAARHRARAAACRAGHVSRRDVFEALDSLIKICALCGKKALYRTGSEGRCSDHKLIKARPAIARIARLEVASADIEEVKNKKWVSDKDVARYRTTALGRQRRR